MKKPVILIIAFIYIIAIAVVGFLGIPARLFHPPVAVTDIELTFDEKLQKLNPSEEYPYRYRINTSTEAEFTITAKVRPDDATEKETIFEKYDDRTEEQYTFTTETNFNSGNTIASFHCAAVEYGTEITTIIIKVRPKDGNMSLSKMIEILVTNF